MLSSLVDLDEGSAPASTNFGAGKRSGTINPLIISFNTLPAGFQGRYDLVKGNKKLLLQKYITEDGIKLGSFQDCMLRSLSGRNKNYQSLLANWRKKIKNLPTAVREDIAKRIKK